MIELSFPARKLGEDIVRLNRKLKDVDETINTTVLGVTNTDGITVTGNKASDDLSKYIVIKGNQFAYNPYRVNVGSIGLTADNQEGLVSPAYIVFETKETIVPEFLLYYLKSSIGINLIRWYGNRGGVRDALRFDDLCKIDIPDLTVKQQLIALGKIKVFEEQVASLTAEIEKQEMLLKKYKDTILNEAIQGKIAQQDENDESASVLLRGIKEEKEQLIKEKKIKKEKPLSPVTDEEKFFNIPNGWEWSRIGICFITTSGSTPSRANKEYFEDGLFNWVKTTDLTNGIVNRCEEKISQKALVDKNLKILPENTVCIAMYGGGGTIGKSGIFKFESTINQSVCAVLPTPFINPEYFHYYIKYSRPKWMNYASSTRKDPNINRGIINNFVIPIPPLNEQKRIVEKVNQLMSLCEELEQNIEQSKKAAENLMKAVLQEAITIKEEVIS
ncbi:restriction endonuclease subunit S [Bacillus cereus]|uniref:restriction endonuclease subunit S n=1 Tax=Bacillus tropicus TaxID=2026188 RepID=UPI00112470BD|nr:restriction endonuclease subunit S [Bacillus tropicus]TNP14074.1 hypothetical protein FHY73_23930 [Bacillus tropicus]